MINGIVDQNCEARLRLVESNESKQRQVIDAVIDTGFTGFLTLPLTVINSLKLRLYSREEGTLGDGSTCSLTFTVVLLFGTVNIGILMLTQPKQTL